MQSHSSSYARGWTEAFTQQQNTGLSVRFWRICCDLLLFNICLQLGLTGIVMQGSNTIQVDSACNNIYAILQSIREQLSIPFRHRNMIMPQQSLHFVDTGAIVDQ